MLMWKRAKNSPIMRKMLGNTNIAKALDKVSERDEFYRDMQSKGVGGVTKDEMKEVFGKYVSGKSRHISRKEGYAIAKEFFPDEARRYKFISEPPKGVPNGFSGGSSKGVVTISSSSDTGANNPHPRSGINYLVKYGPGAFRQGNDNRSTFFKRDEIKQPGVSASFQKIKDRQTGSSIKSGQRTSYFSSIRRVMRGS